MAISPNRRPTIVRARGGFSPRWIQNAMKSLGTTTKEVLKDITPNLSYATNTVASNTASLVQDIRKGNISASRIMKAVSSNKYMQYAQTAYKNALSDIRTGNLNNTKRTDKAFDKSMGFDDNSFSFGDIDGGDNINIEMGDSGTADVVMQLSTQVEHAAVANIKMQKASMDALIASNASMMNLSNNQHAEVMTHLSNISNSLTALVEYQNENMTKFIEASMTYYDKIGKVHDNANNDEKDNKVQVNDIFNNKTTGGINFSNYKKLIKQNLKRTISEDPNLSMLKMVVDNEQMMDMLVSNPIGMASKMILSSAIPKVVTDTLKGFEEAFSTAIPNMLMQITDMQGSNSMLYKYIGKIFGLDMRRKESFDKATVDKGPIPFDGETKHAITHIITTELSKQTAYLSILANNVNKNADELVDKNRTFFSHAANDWVNKDKASKTIADEIVFAITNAFNGSNFGKSLDRFAEKYEKEEDKEEARNTIQELFYDILKTGKNVDLDVLIKLVNNSGATKKMRNDLKSYIRDMAEKDTRSFDQSNLGLINANAAYQNIVKKIQDEGIDYNIQNTLFKDNADIDTTVYDIMKWGKENRNKRHKVSKQKDPLLTSALNVDEDEAVTMYEKITGGFIKFFNDVTTDSQSAIENSARNLMNAALARISDLGKATMLKLFGEKGEHGAREGGIFSEVANSFTDFGNSIKWHIFGKAYTDTKGVSHEANGDSVFGTLKNIGNDIKDGIMMKIFGKKKDENGKYVKESDGLFDKVKSTLLSGVNTWKDAFFGIDPNDPNAEELRKENSEKALQYVKDAVPNMTYGAVGGLAFGSMGGILGSLIGGPLAGIGIGMAVGLASRSEKFKTWLFGEEVDGERVGGLISKNVQTYFKENKEYMIGSAAIGGLGGAITGGGLLGTLIGGPFAGAIMGMASGYVLKSKTFKEFLFGDEETGKMGLIKSIKYRFSQAFVGKDNEETESMIGSAGMKFLGTSAVGMGAGGLIGLMLGGPVFGALAGLALSAKAAKGTLREYLFGKEDGLTLADGTKVRKQGLFGVIGNYVNANIIKPMSTEIKFIAKDFMSTVKHRMMAPFTFLAESIAQNIGAFIAEKWNALKGITMSVLTGVKNTFMKAISPVTNVIGKSMTMAADFVWKNTKFIMSAPGVLITSALKALNLKKIIGNIPLVKFFRTLGKDVRHAIFGGIKGLFKGVFHLIKAPFRAIKWAGGTVLGWGKSLWNSNMMEGARNKVRDIKSKVVQSDAFQDIKTWWQGYGLSDDSIIQKIRRNQEEYKKEQADIRDQKKKNKQHDKNAKIIARASRGQFGDDTEAARMWIARHRPDLLSKLQGDTVDDDMKKSKMAKNGSDGEEMSEEQLGRAKKLSWKGRLLKYLANINRSTESMAKGDDPSDYESIDDEGKRKEKEEEDAKKKKEQEEAEAAKAERERWNKLSWWQKLKETAGETGIDEDGANDLASNTDSWFKQAAIMGNSAWKFVKNDFLRGTRDILFGEDEGPSKNERFINRWTGGRKFKNTEEALAWLQEHNPRKYAQYINKFGGAGDVENHFLGGILGKGLSLVGEMGAELLHTDDKGKTKVLPHDKTKKLINGGLKPGDIEKAFDVSHKTKEAEEEEEDSEEEKQADENRAARLASLKARESVGETTEEDRAEINAAKIAIELDKRADSQNKANNRGYTAAEQLRDREEAKFRDQQIKASATIAEGVTSTNDL